MLEMQSVLTDVCGVCESVMRDEQIKMLFGVNTPGGPWNIVLDVGPDPLQRKGEGDQFSMLGFPPISGTAEDRNLKFCLLIEG